MMSQGELKWVNKYSVVTIDQNKYSVPDYLVGKFVNVKAYPDTIEIYYKNNKEPNIEDRINHIIGPWI